MDILTLSTGRIINAFNGIVGLGPDLAVYEGYDGIIFEREAKITSQERAELAEFMIARWKAFAQGSWPA